MSALRPTVRQQPWLLLLAALCVAGLLAAAPARAAGTPDLQLAGGPDATVLYGDAVPVALTASLPAGAPKGYNLAYRAVLPAGVHYAAGSAGEADGEPRILANAPSTGRTTLIWENVGDLVASASHTLAFEVTYDDTSSASPARHDVGDVLAFDTGAYIATGPRDVADFDATGAPTGPNAPGASPPVVNTYDGWAARSSSSTLTAIEIEKSEPHPEGEIPRGLHDHQTVYTLDVTNNRVNPTGDLVVDDYLPAGLEFLGCAATPDHTTDAPTNRGSAQEYPGSGPIEVAHPTAAEGCVAPDLVETVSLDPDGASGPLPSGVYTHVRWSGLGTLAPKAVRTLTYAAAVPIRENRTTWSGATPGTTGAQAANLDNNAGPETYDEQPLLNGAFAAGTYRSPVAGDVPVSDEGTLLRTAEDLAIQKSNDRRTLEQGDLTTWTIDVQASEYRSIDDVVVRDTVPDGLCPLGAKTLAHEPTAQDAECAPVAGRGPSDPYAAADEQADGTYAVVWDATAMPSLAHLRPSATRRITFTTRTREHYQQDFADAAPILSRDAVTNSISTTGTDWVRCTSTPNDCVGAGPGMKIDHDETDGVPDTDVSGSGKVASGPSILKQVGARLPASGDCSDLAGADYGKTVPEYGPGDRVCWKVRLDFPAKLNTTSQDVFDVLPPGLEYVPGSSKVTSADTLPVGPIDTSVAGRLRWPIGTANDVDHGGQTFEVTFASTVGSPLGHASGDVLGNLQKFSYENTAGTAFTLRDRTDFALELPVLDLKKGVARIDAGPRLGPDVDGKEVLGGDVVEYRLDVSNTGDAAAADHRVWDVLPAGISCADVDASSITDGGTCDAAAGRIEWTVGEELAPGASRTLGYALKIPVGVAPGRTFVNRAAVVEYGYVGNTGTRYALVPANAAVEDPALPAANVPEAEDPSDVHTPAVSVLKERTTSVTETGNAAAGEATIGETVTYTVTTRIPAGTTLYGTPTVVDDLGARQALVPGSLSGTLNGAALPSGGVTLSESGNVVRATFGLSHTNAAGEDVLVLTFRAKVLDVAANVRGAKLPNTATLAYRDEQNGAGSAASSVDSTIVEPKTTLTKTHTPTGRAQPGQILTFSVKASATADSASTAFSPAHAVTVVDTMPAGTDPVDAAGATIPDGGTVPTTGTATTTGVWNAAARTITWTPSTTPGLATILPGASVTLTYRARLEPTSVSGRTYVNTVADQIASLDPATGGVRTPASPGTTAPDYKATAQDSVLVALPTLAKTVTPTTVTIGDEVTWTVRATLPKALGYFDATVVDTVPTGFDVDGYGPMTCVSGCVAGDPVPTSFALTGTTTKQAAWFLGDLGASDADRVYELVLRGHVRDTYVGTTTKVLDGQTLTNSVGLRANRTNKLTAPTTVPASTSYDDAVGPVTAANAVKEPKLALTKTADRGPFVEGGDVVTYTVAVKNTGSSAAYDLVVDDLPDAELTDVALSAGVSTSRNTDGWTAEDRDLRWVVPGPVAPGESVTFTYTAKVRPGSTLVSGDPIANTAKVTEAYGLPKATRDADPDYVFRRYTGPEATVALTSAVPRLSIEKTPDAGTATAGARSSFTIRVTNADAHATAHGVVVHDVLPDGLTYAPGTATASPAAGFTETGASGRTVDWRIGALAPGATTTITVPVELDDDLDSGALLTNTASTHADEAPTDKSDTGSLKVVTKADLSVTKTADHRPVVPGTDLEYAIVVRNAGPSEARDATLRDVLPSYLSAVSVDDADCAITGRTVACDLGTMAPGASRTVRVVAHVDPARTTDVVNAADVSTSTSDTDGTNDHAEATVPVKPTADVSITKAASGSVFQGGDTVTYTLRAHNRGPSTATGVVIDDEIPADLTLVSTTPGAPDCTIADARVHCAVGTLAPGADRTVTIVTRARGTAPSPDASGESHKITVGKVDRSEALDAGETRTYDVGCPADGIASDGSVEVVHVDQGAGSPADVEVVEARTTAQGGYRFTVRNRTSGRAQVKLWVTCLPKGTDPGPSHDHALDVGAVQTLSTGTLAVGRHEFTIPTTAGHRAVAPGLEVLQGRARLVGGEPDGTGWRFTVEVLEPAKVDLSIRALSDYTASGGDPLHVHGFAFSHEVRKVTIPAGESDQHRVSCPAGSKGITATYDLPAGVVALGSAPEPINRDFRLLNTTGGPVEVTLDLECMSIETTDPVEVVTVVNTATVDAATFDPEPGNDTAAATIGVERVPGSAATPGPGPAAQGPATTADLGAAPGPSAAAATPGPAPAAPAPGAPSAPAVPLRFGTFRLAATAATATVPVSCSGTATCRGTVTVTAQVPATLRAKGGSRTRRVVLGKASYVVRAGRTTTVTVKIAKRYRTLLRTRAVRSVAVSSGRVSTKRSVVVARPSKSRRG
jgi:fimbrial isopeptide formation D2 family protein/uncharacterized repeat protein (TIGR01451 family)